MGVTNMLFYLLNAIFLIFQSINIQLHTFYSNLFKSKI